jgi:regulator of protease activity HflC (stomatin/prohibitin superfamily)
MKLGKAYNKAIPKAKGEAEKMIREAEGYALDKINNETGIKNYFRDFCSRNFLVITGFLSGALFVVNETRQVVITQFGKPVGSPITTAGLHFKKPFF